MAESTYDVTTPMLMFVTPVVKAEFVALWIVMLVPDCGLFTQFRVIVNGATREMAAVTPEGGSGGPGTTAFEGPDDGPVPKMFVAFTVNV